MLKFQQNPIKMQKYLQVLKKCPLFFNIKEEDLPKMLFCLSAKVLTFDKKYTVIAEGSPFKYVGILLSGGAQITSVDYYGNRNILSNIESGEIFGEAFACAGVNSNVSVVAVEKSEIMFIKCSRMLYSCSNACGFHGQLIQNLIRGLAQKNLFFHQKTLITAKRTTREKLLSYLNACAKKANSNTFEIPFDRQALADYLQVERSGLSAEISKLRAEKVLKSEKNKFTLL